MSSLFAADPVALKELRGVSRRWQTYVGRCLFVGVTAYLLYEYWKEAWRALPGRAAAVSVSQFAELGRAIFHRCEGVSLTLTILAAVIAGADTIAREARNGTLGLLFMTYLTPRRVVLGKWKGAMMIAFSLYLCSLPVLAISVYLGGAGIEDLARSAAFTLGLAAVGAAVAISFSARMKSAGTAVAATIPIMLLILMAVGAADAIGGLVWTAVARPGALTHTGGIASILACFLLVNAYLNKAVRQVQERTGTLNSPVDIAREKRALALEDLRDQRASKPRRILRTWRAVWEDNPLLWKEFTLRPALRIREDWRTRSYIILFAFFIASWVSTGLGSSRAFFNLWGTFFTVVALTGGCLLFAPEKEGRQWLLLLSTPITAIQIVRAKLLCGLIFPEALGLILLYLLALAGWLGVQTISTIALAAAVASLFILFAYTLAAAASLRARTARASFVFAGGVVAFLVTVPSLVTTAARPLRGLSGPGWSEFWSWVEALDPATVLGWFDVDRHVYRMTPPEAYAMAVRYFTLYLPVTLLLPVEMVLRFRRITVQA